MPISSNITSTICYSSETGEVVITVGNWGRGQGPKEASYARASRNDLHAWGKRFINFEPQHAMKEKTIDKSQERHHSTVR